MANNLMSKPVLETMEPLAQVYLVYNNKDYRSSLAALLTLVTKASLGLENVDNTSDKNKPLSDEAKAALEEKADKSNTATLAQIDDLARQLQDKVTQKQLNDAITALEAKITEGGITDAELEAALQPIRQAQQAMQAQIDTLLQGQTNLATKTELNDAISQLQSGVTASFTSVDNQIRGLGTSLQGLQGAITLLEEGKADKPIRPQDIQNLKDWIEENVEIADEYELPIAKEDELGGVMIGDGLNVDASGKVSVTLGNVSFNDNNSEW